MVRYTVNNDTVIVELSYNQLNLSRYTQEYFTNKGIEAEITIFTKNQLIKGGNSINKDDYTLLPEEVKEDKNITIPYRYFDYRFNVVKNIIKNIKLPKPKSKEDVKEETPENNQQETEEKKEIIQENNKPNYFVETFKQIPLLVSNLFKKNEVKIQQQKEEEPRENKEEQTQLEEVKIQEEPQEQQLEEKREQQENPPEIIPEEEKIEIKIKGSIIEIEKNKIDIKILDGLKREIMEWGDVKCCDVVTVRGGGVGVEVYIIIGEVCDVGEVLGCYIRRKVLDMNRIEGTYWDKEIGLWCGGEDGDRDGDDEKKE